MGEERGGGGGRERNHCNVRGGKKNVKAAERKRKEGVECVRAGERENAQNVRDT